MCGRFTLMTAEDYQDLVDIVNQASQAVKGAEMKLQGDVYPTNMAPVITMQEGSRRVEAYKWGFPNFRNKGVIINARAETAAEKPTFRGCLPSRRCVIPSSGFYEWDKKGDRQKYLFRQQGHGLYMAGLYALYDGEPRFVILTTAANSSVEDIHDRMPVVLEPERIDRWLLDYDAAMKLLRETPPMLEKTAV